MKKSSRPALKRLFLCFLLLYLLITLLPPLLYYYIPGPTASAPGQAVPEPTPGPALSPFLFSSEQAGSPHNLAIA